MKSVTARGGGRKVQFFVCFTNCILFVLLDLVVLVNNVDFAKILIESGSESNIQLASHVIFDNDTIDPSIKVKQINKQAVFVKVILNNFIGEINNMTDPHYRLRIMKSCILNQYTVVVLKKHSSYTRYVNEKIRRHERQKMLFRFN